MTGVVVGIDPSLTSTGVVQLKHGTPFATACYGRSCHRAASYDQRADRMTFTLAAVLQAVSRQAELVVIEGMAYGAGGYHTDPDVFGLWWHIYTHLHARGVPIAVIPPPTLKVWATGRPGGGRADKTEILATVSTWWPADVIIRNDDVADAAAAATLGAAYLGHPTPFYLGRRHHETIAGLTWPAAIANFPIGNNTEVPA